MGDKETGLGMVSRAMNVGAALTSAHLTLARQEARRDLFRLLFGGVLVCVGLLCLGTGWIGAQFTLLVQLNARGISWPEAAAWVSGGNLLVGVVSLLLATRLFQRPVLAESRAQIKKTVTALVE